MCRTITLRLSVGTKGFQHILRVVPRRLATQACHMIDSSMRGQLAALLKQTRVTDRVWQQAILRMSYGGIGITSAVDVADPALWMAFTLPSKPLGSSACAILSYRSTPSSAPSLRKAHRLQPPHSINCLG